MTNLSVLVIMKDNPKFIGTVAVNFRNMVRIKIGKCASFIGISTISIQLIRNISDNKKVNETQEHSLSEHHLLSKDPVCLFDKWLNFAKNDPKTDGANFMCLATATKSGLPSARMMTLKDYSDEGFVFFTSYKSRKGEELESNPNAALIFYWGQFARSVRIEGTIEHISCGKSDDEFHKGTYDSQIGALLCEQSTPIQDRLALDCKSRKMRKQYPEGKVPCPPNWGGYIVRPHTIEFWQGHKDSLHDRIRFRRPKATEPDGVLTHEAENGWVYERLCPPCYTNLHSNFNDNTEAQLAPDYQTKMDVSGMRADYNNKQNLFLEENLKIKEPINLFDEWFKIIKNDPRTVEANAMCLSTATKNGIPSARYVLLKGYNKEGFIFFTHYTSRKGQELEENPKAALTFYWEHHSRSVRIEGDVEKLPFSQADEYFNKRPYQSQIGALCSDQSKPVAGRNILAEKERELKNKYTEGTVPRPQLWGGYLVKPLSIEFWQGQTDRIHDRIKFRKPEKNEPDGVLTHQAEDGWVYERLNP